MSMNVPSQTNPPAAWSGGRRVGALAVGALLLLGTATRAQDLEPRRWGHLPVGANFAGVGYVWTKGDVSLDPVLRLEDVRFDLQTVALKYLRSFELFDKSARFELTQAWQDGTWSGLLDGARASTDRSGWADTTLRFAVNLLGAPPLHGTEFADYRASVADSETVIGAGLAVGLPTGEYFADRLINLGSNRFTFRPEVGVVHSWGQWSAEITGAAWFFTDNDDFFSGNRLAQDPLAALQGHLIYTFRPGLWLGASIGYAAGGRSTINGVAKNDRRNQLSWALSLGVPLNSQVGLKLAYLGSRAGERIGTDSDTLALAVSVLW
jgi:hypothetical protein